HAARAYAELLRSEACSVYLVDPDGRLARSADYRVEGAGAPDRAPAEAEQIAARALTGRRTLAAQGEAASFLAAPMILRGSLVGAVVLENSAPRAYSSEEHAALAAACAALVTVVENARIIGALDRGER